MRIHKIAGRERPAKRRLPDIVDLFIYFVGASSPDPFKPNGLEIDPDPIQPNGLEIEGSCDLPYK